MKKKEINDRSVVEMLNSQRVFFNSGQQKAFIDMIAHNLNISFSDMAKFLGISRRTLSDWRREKFLMSRHAVDSLCKIADVPFPNNVELRDPYWYVLTGAKAGGESTLRKYGRIPGEESYRRRRWKEWWEREGKLQRNSNFIAKSINSPRKSAELAEFVGIVLGDGGLTDRQLTVTLHINDDALYGKYVCLLIKQLFGVMPSVYPSNSVNKLVVSRTALIQFCTQKLGLRTGNKVRHQVGVPSWVDTKISFQTACLRGLIDTDGSVFLHRYKVNQKTYLYRKLVFTSLSQPLCDWAFAVMATLGLHPRLSRGKDVWLDRIGDVEAYFRIVRPHNPKHVSRFMSDPNLDETYSNRV